MDIDALKREAAGPVLASADNLTEVAADLADAFAGDVMFDWLLRPGPRSDDARGKLFAFLVRKMAWGVGRIERPASGGAAGIWMPFEFVGPLPLIKEIQALPVMLQTSGLGRLGRLLAVQADLDKHHPTHRRHAYLWFLGVRRSLQGHGLGSRLLKAATDRLDAAGEPAYLETQTERNVDLYRRHGFEVISEHRARADAPMMWSMWREPSR